MDTEKLSTNNQNGASTTPVAVAPVTPASESKPSRSGGLNKTVLLCTIVVAITLLVSTVLGAWMIDRNRGTTTGYTGIDATRYQAVFLTNGQVYFGKLSDGGSELIKLTNIWYLQVQQGQQSVDTLKDSQNQITLSKLGNELHGPDDAMSISKDQVLFWENLKNDSKVVKTIKEAK